MLKFSHYILFQNNFAPNNWINIFPLLILLYDMTKLPDITPIICQWYYLAWSICKEEYPTARRKTCAQPNITIAREVTYAKTSWFTSCACACYLYACSHWSPFSDEIQSTATRVVRSERVWNRPPVLILTDSANKPPSRLHAVSPRTMFSYDKSFEAVTVLLALNFSVQPIKFSSLHTGRNFGLGLLQLSDWCAFHRCPWIPALLRFLCFWKTKWNINFNRWALYSQLKLTVSAVGILPSSRHPEHI